MIRPNILAALGAAVLAVADTGAQDSAPLRFSGSLRGGYWSSTRDLDGERPLGAGMAWLKGTTTVGRGITLFAEGWGALRGPAGDGEAVIELRETFVDAALGGLDLRVGRQIVVWGRA